MTLARRLLVGSLIVVLTLVAVVVVIAGARLRNRLVDEALGELERDARLVSVSWSERSDADSLARVIGEALGYRVTLIDPRGTVVGDTEFAADSRRRLENHADRPEVAAARRDGRGSARRRSASAGDEELYAALRHPLGTVRVSMDTRRVDAVVAGARRDVLVSGLAALAGVLILASLFARSISRPVVELRDVARAIAAGDLSRRPALGAPGEVGQLATALHRMAEQLDQRLRALEADDQLMAALLESLEEGVLALDARGRVVRINDRGRVLLNASAPLPFSSDLLPRDPVLREAVARAGAGESTPAVEIVLDDRTVTVSARPLAGGAVVTLFDLTIVRRLETIRRDFVANVSHELKTPLTAVSGYAETLMDPEIPPEQQRRFLNTIRENSWRMQRIVDDLLDLSRIESGGWRPCAQPVDVRAVADEVLVAVRESAQRKGVELTATIPASAARVTADATAFRQVLANLVENAVRYTTSGRVDVSARASGDGVWLDVADTGVGIAPEHLPRIFERFYRADAARTREHGGTGLGLAIVRHLVEAHGGRVDARSTVGRGTTISVWFPAGASGTA